MPVPSTPMRGGHRQRGAAAVEFAVVALVFFILVFGMIELARIVYMINTLSDVTRSAARSAANIDWTDGPALQRAKERAIFRDSPGTLPFGAPITDRHIRIDYLYLKQQQGTGALSMEPVTAGLMPSCPGANRHNCLKQPYGDGASATNTCIRLVRARICKPDLTECENELHTPILSLLNLNVPLPLSTTIVNAETLGYRPGDPICL